MNNLRTAPKSNLLLALAALGVVFGDIGTSPLYAMPAALRGLPITSDNVLGVLSLIFWTLILVISTRYMTVFLRADNHGEGGVLALLALLKKKGNHFYRILFLLGVLGAGLLLGDGMLTPAISVLSAIEGLNVISPHFSHYILPITLTILLVLFLSQHFGTAKIGNSFGPILLIWFLVIGILGAVRIFQNPSVIYAINPYYGFKFFYNNGWAGYKLLGGIFLVVTGAEALYADLGHFGRTPIRIGWFAVALPGLLLEYFGEGAYLIKFPQIIVNPFFAAAPSWFVYPLLILATAATIIASQAVISASFSLAKQAMLLNLCPRFLIVQTSAREQGQIYVPKINFILAVGTLLLVLIFKSSGALAGAYGIAVNLVMIIVALLVMMVAHQYWHWSKTKILQIFSLFTIIDFAFFGANLHKVLEGGWIPLVFALVCAVIMVTWYNGIKVLRASHYMNQVNLKEIIDEFSHTHLHYMPHEAAIFITDPYDQSGGSFLHLLKQIQILPEHILIVSVNIGSRPFVPPKERCELVKISRHIYHLALHYGFMQTINVPKTLSHASKNNDLPFSLDIDKVLYLVEIIEVNITQKKHRNLQYWQKNIFRKLLRSSTVEFKFFRLPHNRTIIIGASCNI